jgi:hypothetical protein
MVELEPAIKAALAKIQEDPIQVGALVRVLINHAALLAYSTVGTNCDLQFRTDEDFAGVAGAIWQAQLAAGEQAAADLQAQFGKVPNEISERCKLAPSDPAKRPGLAPANKLPKEVGAPSSIEDFLGDLGTSEEEDDEDLFAKIAASRGAGGMAN